MPPIEVGFELLIRSVPRDLQVFDVRFWHVALELRDPLVDARDDAVISREGGGGARAPFVDPPGADC